jgi:UDP-glucose 4-epimerase
MKVLVAGGAGFIGSAVVKALVDLGHDVIALDNFLSGDRGNLRVVIDQVRLIEADIRNRDTILGVDGKIDVIVHLAFPTPLCTRDHDKQFHDIAGQGTANLLELALRDDAYFLYGSSISVYGKQVYLPIDEKHPATPMLVYGANKLLGEHLCSAFGQIHGLSYGAVRISDTFGPRDKRSNAINHFMAAARDGGTMRISGGGAQRRSYTYVSDVAAAMALAVTNRLDNEVVNLVGDQAISIRDLAGLIRDEVNDNSSIEYSDGVPDDRHYVFNNARFADAVGHIPWTSIREGIALIRDAVD